MSDRSSFFKRPLVRLALGVLAGLALWMKFDRRGGVVGAAVLIGVLVATSMLSLVQDRRSSRTPSEQVEDAWQEQAEAEDDMEAAWKQKTG